MSVAVTKRSVAIREAWKNGITSNKEVVEYVKKNYGIDIQPTYVSVVKSHDRIKRDSRSQIKVNGNYLDDMETIKSLVAKYNKDNVIRMINIVTESN